MLLVIGGHMNTFIKAIISGIIVGIGGSIYLASTNPVIGAALFHLDYFMYYTINLNYLLG